MLLRIIRTALVVLGCSPLVALSATQQEAQTLAEKATSYVEAHGLEQSRQTMHDKAGGFIDGELYVFVLDFEGETLIHGGNPKLVGRNLSAMKDPSGNYFVKNMAKTAITAGTGWVKYMWKHPQTNKLTPKSSYVSRIPSMDAYVGVGVYD
ncbi:MAG: cache domain-containing protein [Motiliproteus sp.]